MVKPSGRDELPRRTAVSTMTNAEETPP